MASRYTYDNKLANEITSGKITKYIPDTAATLKGTTGICYDFSSLFAAMCRSQGIPCALTKGYAGLLQLPRLEQGKPERQVVSD